MGETTNAEFPPATPEEIWAILRETARRQEETDRMLQETARRQEETARRQEETDRQMKKTDRRMKETNRQIGKLGNRFGKMVEHLIVPNMTEKFNELGFDFIRSVENLKIREQGNPDPLAEIDILLENGDVALAIEVKAKPDQNEVKDFVLKMGVLRKDADKRGDRRTFLGALAGAIMDTSVRTYAQNCGFYVIEQTGDTVRIVQSEGFKPREWSFGG